MSKYTKILLFVLSLGIVAFLVYLAVLHRNETPDMNLAEVRGPVRSLRLASYACDAHGNIINDSLTWNNRYFEFDNNGVMTKGQVDNIPGDKHPMRLHRNNKSQIEFVQVYLPAWDSWYDTQFSYDENHRVVAAEVHSPDGVSNVTFTYDHIGNVVTEKEVNIKGEPYISVTRFRILLTDDYDNWIKALVTIDYNISGERTREYRLDVREITYY